jgi:hypothetical protein
MFGLATLHCRNTSSITNYRHQANLPPQPAYRQLGTDEVIVLTFVRWRLFQPFLPQANVYSVAAAAAAFLAQSTVLCSHWKLDAAAAAAANSITQGAFELQEL